MHFVFEYIICEVGLGAYVYLSPDSNLPVYVPRNHSRTDLVCLHLG